MKYVVLGTSGLQVSRIAFGTWQLGGDWGPTDAAAATAAIRTAADGGVTLFDTAQAYGFGRSEQFLAGALKGLRRDEVVLATKGGLRSTERGLVRDSSARSIRRGVEESLAALATDYLDVFHVHWPDPTTSFDETGEVLSDLLSEGKILHAGVSNFDARQMERFGETLPVETVQTPYHLFRRDVEEDVLPYAVDHDVGVLVYGALAHGLLSGGLRPTTSFEPDDWRSKSEIFQGDSYRSNLEVVTELSRVAEEVGITLPQLAVAWTLNDPAVHVTIVGTRRPDHVVDVLAAADLDLADTVIDRIENIAGRAVGVGGPTPETV